MKNLLVVDVQNGYIHDENKEVVEKIDAYLRNNVFDNIIYTKYIKTERDYHMHLFSDGLYDKEEKKIAVKKIPKSKYFTKRTHGLTIEILNYIQKNSITELEVCGIDNVGSIDFIINMLKNNNIEVTKLSELICPSSKYFPKVYTQYCLALPTINGFHIADIYCNKTFNNLDGITEFSILSFAVLEWLLHSPKTMLNLKTILNYYSKLFPIKNNLSYQQWVNNGCRGFRNSDDQLIIKMCSPIAWCINAQKEVDELILNCLACVNHNELNLLTARIVCQTVLFLRHGVSKHDLLAKLEQYFNLNFNDKDFELIKFVLLSFINTTNLSEAIKLTTNYCGDKYLATYLLGIFAEAYYNKTLISASEETSVLLHEKFKALLFDFYKQNEQTFKLF